MFKRFFPRLSDNNLIKGANSTLARFGHLNALVDYINNVPPGSGIASVQPGTGITIDDSDPVNPIINAEGGTSGDYLPLAGGTMDDGATVNFQRGGQLIINYPNGDSIVIGTTYNTYNAIAIIDNAVGQTLYAYIRGGDLYLENPSSGDTVGGINTIINQLQSSKLTIFNGYNTTTQGAFGTADILYVGFNEKQYLDNGVAGYKGYSQIKRYYFIDSCSYSQSGTNAPTIDSIFESQAQDFPITGKTLSRQGVGHYRIEYDQPLTAIDYLPMDFSRIKVITSQGAEPNVCISYTVPGFTAVNRLAIDIFTRQPSTGALIDSHLDKSVIEVYFYL